MITILRFYDIGNDKSVNNKELYSALSCGNRTSKGRPLHIELSRFLKL